MIGLIVELLTTSLLPLALVLSYAYVVALRAYVERGKMKHASLFLGVVLLWIAALMGPLTLVSAFVASLAFVLLIWTPKVNIKIMKRLIDRLKRAKEEFVKGCKTNFGCLLRFLALWPALGAVAVSTYAIMAPIIMFIIGYLLKPRQSFKGPLSFLNNVIAIAIVLVAWFYAVMNTIENILLPKWLVLQNYALSGEVSKLPMTAKILAKYIGKEAAYAYIAILILLALYTVFRIHSVAPKSELKHAMTLFAPFLGYAIASNKLGEPLTSIAYALGITFSVIASPKFQGIQERGGRVIERVLVWFDAIAKRLFEFDVPMGPLRRLIR